MINTKSQWSIQRSSSWATNWGELEISDDEEELVQQMVSVAGICRLGKPGKQSGDLFSSVAAFLLKHYSAKLSLEHFLLNTLLNFHDDTLLFIKHTLMILQECSILC